MLFNGMRSIKSRSLPTFFLRVIVQYWHKLVDALRKFVKNECAQNYVEIFSIVSLLTIYLMYIFADA